MFLVLIFPNRVALEAITTMSLLQCWQHVPDPIEMVHDVSYSIIPFLSILPCNVIYHVQARIQVPRLQGLGPQTSRVWVSNCAIGRKGQDARMVATEELDMDARVKAVVDAEERQREQERQGMCG